MNNILITGGTGFLGNIIYNTLKDTNNVFTLSRNSVNYKCDLTKEIPEFNLKFDCIIHTAGLAHLIKKKEIQHNQYEKVNLVGTRNLLIGLKENMLPNKFIYISSVSVYGQNKGILINEEANLIFNDDYSKSKIESEKIITDWCKKNNVICTILRLPLVVGKNPPGNLGNLINSIKKRHFFLIKDHNPQKSMVLAEDVAHYIPYISEIGGIYNLTDGSHPKLKDIVLIIAKKHKIKFIPTFHIFFAKIIAYFGDIFPHNIPLNSTSLNKLCTSLTFDDKKAKSNDWNPNSVITWLKNNEI